jgi:predicted nucleic-acid-binding protein
MIGVDTNILVRFFVQDDPQQSGRASRFMAARASDDPGFVDHIVLCELVWVLEYSYHLSRERIFDALEVIMRSDRLKVAEPQQDVWAALHEYLAGADFADALIATTNRRLGCEHTVTFDRKAARRPGFLLL